MEDHLRQFDKPPELVVADRNVHSKDNERLAKGFGVKKVCLPKAGKKSALREEYEGQGWYKRARRFRAGIEGRISVMKRREYLGRWAALDEQRDVRGTDAAPHDAPALLHVRRLLRAASGQPLLACYTGVPRFSASLSSTRGVNHMDELAEFVSVTGCGRVAASRQGSG